MMFQLERTYRIVLVKTGNLFIHIFLQKGEEGGRREKKIFERKRKETNWGQKKLKKKRKKEN